MAEASAVAFGRYLRQLRERRGLSLGRVCELTKGTPEPIDKGTLSRLERGQQTPSIYRLGPLSRIYAISADALLERMELDREVDRLEGLETGGASYDELHREGVASVIRGNRKWHTYTYFRDALTMAPSEKRTVAAINFVTAIRSLGKNALALHELRELELTGDLDDGQRAVLHERMAICCRCLGDMRGAEEYAESATLKAIALGDPRTLAYAYSARAGVAIEQERWTPAYDDVLKALAAHREGEAQRSQLEPNPVFEAQMLLMLAECSLHVRNLARTRRLTLSARHLSEQHDFTFGLAYSELILGWIDEGAGHIEQALARWRKAATLAARIDYPRITFTAEVEIFRQALGAGDKSRARASRRRLERLAPWIPQHIPAARRFKKLIDQGAIHEELPKNPDLRAADGVGVSSGRRRPVRGRSAVAADARGTAGLD